MYHVPQHLARQPVFWVCLFTALAVAIVWDIGLAYGRELMLQRWVRRARPRRQVSFSSSRGLNDCATLRSNSMEMSGRSRSSSAPAAPLLRSSDEGSQTWPADRFSSRRRASSFAFEPPERKSSGSFGLHPTAGDTSLLDNGAAAVVGSQTLVLDTSRFAQQTLPSIHFKPTYQTVSAILLVVGSLLLALGCWVLPSSNAVVEIVVSYGDTYPKLHAEKGNLSVRDYARNDRSTRSWTVDVPVPAKMERPILVYYNIEPFYQSYARVLHGVSDVELMGGTASPEQRLAVCPYVATRFDNGREIVPCGLMATSLFNDTFEVLDTSNIGISVEETNIAWSSDVERFRNPSNYRDENISWLFERYPGIVNVSKGVQDEKFVTWMRPAALPSVLKPYGYLSQDLHAGQNLTVRITSRFSVHGTQKSPGDPFTAHSGKISIGGSLRAANVTISVAKEMCRFQLNGCKGFTFMGDDAKSDSEVRPIIFKNEWNLGKKGWMSYKLEETLFKKRLAITTLSPLGGRNNKLGAFLIGSGSMCIILVCIIFWFHRWYHALGSG